MLFNWKSLRSEADGVWLSDVKILIQMFHSTGNKYNFIYLLGEDEKNMSYFIDGAFCLDRLIFLLIKYLLEQNNSCPDIQAFFWVATFFLWKENKRIQLEYCLWCLFQRNILSFLMKKETFFFLTHRDWKFWNERS